MMMAPAMTPPTVGMKVSRPVWMPSASAPGMPITDRPIETTTAIVVIVTS